MKNKDLFIVSLLFTLIIGSYSLINSSISNDRLKQQLDIANKSLIKLDTLNAQYILMLNSMNNYADELEYKIKDMEHKEKLIKDLVRYR